MFYVFCTLLCVRSSIAIILMGKRELVALLNLSSWCLVMVERLFLAVPQGCLRYVIGFILIILTYYFCGNLLVNNSFAELLYFVSARGLRKMKLNITGIMQVLIFWPNLLNTLVLYYMLKLFFNFVP